MAKKLFFLILILNLSHQSNAQLNRGGNIIGRIIDSKTGDALPGANVMIKGTMFGASTDLDGYYKIAQVPAGAYVLQATMMGYKSEQHDIVIQANQQSTQDFKLIETAIETPALVVTAGKKAQSFQDVPNSVSLVLSEEIAQRNVTYLDEILEYTPGVNVLEGDVNIRGSSGYSMGAGSRVLLLVDGIPMMPGDSGDIKWDIIPLSQIDRVEVVKGAGSALYGSHALGGVINIISKEPTSQPLAEIKFTAGLYDDPYHDEWKWTDKLRHYNRTSVSHASRFKNSGLLLSAGRIETTGYQQNGWSKNYSLLGRFDTKFNSNSSLLIQSNYVTSEGGEIFLWKNQNDVYEMPVTSVGDETNSYKFSLNGVYRQLISQKFTYKVRTSYFRNYWKHDYHDNNDFSKAEKYGLEIQGDYLVNSTHSFTFGFEGIYDVTNSAMFGDHNGSTLALYLQDDIRVSKLISTTIGLRFDHHAVDTGIRDDQFNPKFGLTIKPSNLTTFRGSIGRGFRSPTMAEMFTDTNTSGFQVIPNPELKAERAWSYEIGLNHILANNVLVDIALFHNDYWNFIEPEPDIQNTVQFLNVNRARIRGVDVSAKSSWFNKLLTIGLGYTYLDPIDLKTNETLAYRPNHLFVGSLNVVRGFATAGLDYRYISRLDNVKVYPNEDRVAQKVIDGHIGANWKKYTLTINVNNILNYNYLQIERNIAPMRNYSISLLLNL
ncbi:TonB-dependent receptor [candidate division KSB1 bacterium]|nr:TonB-dependent receptor [candidate division KSB1 bacterium]